MDRMGKQNIYYGWKMVASAFTIYMLTMAFTSYGCSVIVTLTVRALDWSDSLPGFASSIMYAVSAALSVPMSIIIVKLGIRAAFFVALGAGAVSAAALSFLPPSPVLFLAAYVPIGIMVAGVAYAACPCLINAWFDRKKATAMAIYISAGSLGGAIIPPLIQRVTSVNLRAPWMVYLACILFSIGIAFVFVRNNPEDVGEIPDGRTWNRTHPAAGDAAAVQSGSRNVPSLKSCYHSFTFYSLCVQIVSARFIHAGFSSYVVMYALYRGISEENAALLLTIFSVSGLIARLSVSALDYLPISRHFFCVLCMAVMALSGFCLFSASGMPLFVAGAFGIGLGFGWYLPFFTLLQSMCFGRENFPVINGTFNTVSLLGGMAAPMVTLVIYRLTGDFKYSVLILGLLLLFCVVLSILTPIRIIRDDS